MILTSEEIERQVSLKRIVIDPFDVSQLNPNSYNFRLDRTLLTYSAEVLDHRKENATLVHTIPEDGFLLKPGELYLGSTIEKIGSDHYVPLLFGRSSIGRMGLFVQITAPIGDVGFIGNWTLQLTPVRPIRVYPGMKIGQMLFFRTKGKISLYNGKYQNSVGPTASRSYRDDTHQ